MPYRGISQVGKYNTGHITHYVGNSEYSESQVMNLRVLLWVCKLRGHMSVAMGREIRRLTHFGPAWATQKDYYKQTVSLL